MGIHNEVLNHIKDQLQADLIDDIEANDAAIAGVVMLGPLQGDPDPDVARISVTLHENDPDIVYKTGTGTENSWIDKVVETEIGGATTWSRRFCVKSRVLLDHTQEDLDDAREIASTVRGRIEHSLLRTSFSGISYDDEFVVRSIIGDALEGEMLQAGGPGSYDYHIKVRFDVLTTMNGVVT